MLLAPTGFEMSDLKLALNLSRLVAGKDVEKVFLSSPPLDLKAFLASVVVLKS